MKKFIIACSTLLFSCHISMAQTKNAQPAYSPLFINAMKAGIKQLDTATSGPVLLAVSNNFERIGNAEKTKWQPYYFAAYSYVLMAYLTPDKTQIDWLADKADLLLQKAEMLEKNNSEISCLQAMVVSCRIMVDPVARFQTKGKEVQALLGKAKQENSDNPRVYLLQARMQSRTPEAFGGGKAIAKTTIETAIAKFGIFVAADDIAPNWGMNQARSLLDKLVSGN